jgi:hypothetical protein
MMCAYCTAPVGQIVTGRNKAIYCISYVAPTLGNVACKRDPAPPQTV